jgi:hypothetical protein
MGCEVMDPHSAQDRHWRATLDNDYAVHLDGLKIIRIFRDAQEVWSWIVQCMVALASGGFGTEDTLKAAFKTSWDLFWRTLSEPISPSAEGCRPLYRAGRKSGTKLPDPT